MTETSDSSTAQHRVRRGAVALLLLTATLALVVTSVAYGLALDYGDTTASTTDVAVGSLRDWGIGIVLVAALSAWTIAAARRSRGRRLLSAGAAVVVVVTLVGVPIGAVVGVQERYARYPEVPHCTQGFRTGPAVPVVRAAQAGFAELDHPGPFSGGGSSGIDGCESQLIVRGEVDVAAAYRDTLARNGWAVSHDDPHLVVAAKKGNAFEASRDEGGSWSVWIGPEGLEPRPTAPGVVAPRH